MSSFNLRRPSKKLNPSVGRHVVIALSGPPVMTVLDDAEYCDLLMRESRRRSDEVRAGVWNHPRRDQDDVDDAMEEVAWREVR